MPVVMVVDDTDSARELMAKLLRMCGYQTLCASSGMEALQVLQVIRPDVILLDMAMPEMDGLTVLQILRGSERWKTLPVLMVTALSDPKLIEHSKQLGAQGYFVKAQFSTDEMLDQVGR